MPKGVQTANKYPYQMAEKQAHKGFRPPSAMWGIGYFQDQELLRNCLEIVWIFWGFFWDFFEIFLGGFFWRIFLEDFFRGFFGRIFWGGIPCLHC